MSRLASPRELVGRLRTALAQRLQAVKLLRLSKPGVTALFVVTEVLQGLGPVFLLLAVGSIIARTPAAFDERLSSADGQALLRAVGVFAAVLVGERLASTTVAVTRVRVTHQVDGMLRDRAMAAVARLPTLASLEDPTVQNQLTLVKGGFLGTPGAAATATVTVVGRYLQTLGCTVVVAWFSIPVSLYGLAVIVAVRRRWHVAFGDTIRSMIVETERLRRSAYFTDLMLRPAAAKEIRIFGLVDWVVGQQRRYWSEAVTPMFELHARMRRRSNVELVALLSTALLTAILAGRAAARGELGLGALAAILQAQIVAAGLIGPIQEDYMAGAGATGLQALRAIEAAATAAAPAAVAVPPPEGPVGEIRFEGVSFSYPGTTTPVLAHLDLVIHPGQSLAIVGANGAGKTTMVKLLCGLYLPDAGRITVGGEDLGRMDLAVWRRRVCVTFQDFTHYELSADDNVSFGGDRSVEARGRARDTAARVAGATDVLASLPQGWDTVLSREYDGGVELSGGQWQRIALARVLYGMETGGDVLVLDEPTANLDVRAETELFEQLLDALPGKTTILISHRLSSVRRADRIVVLDDGRIVEDGDHGQLLAADGHYATMFRLQAERFTEDLAVDVDVPAGGAG